MQAQPFKQSAPPAGYYTYAYVRADGRPWYIGKGTGRRAWRPHGGKRRWRAPKDEFILILKWGLTNDEALRHERYLIAVLGREMDGGILAGNCSIGGESGACGYRFSPEDKAKQAKGMKKLSLMAATGYGLTLEEWEGLSKPKKTLVHARFQKGVRGRDALLSEDRVETVGYKDLPQNLKKEEAAAIRLGVPLGKYRSLSYKERNNFKVWLKENPGADPLRWIEMTPAQRTADRRAKVAESLLRNGAQKYGVPFDLWKNLTMLQRKNVGKRYARGIRGAALLEGLL